MRSNLIVIDDFYNNVDDVREFALKQNFDVTGNYPGARTKSAVNDATKQAIAAIIEPHGGKLLNFGDYDGTPLYSGSFQMCTQNARRTWIHADNYNNWAGIIYLTPDAPLTGGTEFYRYDRLNEMYSDRQKNEMHGEDSQDWTKWSPHLTVGNVYNRAIFFRSDMYHASVDYFGRTAQDGRLIQVFFMSTEH